MKTIKAHKKVLWAVEHRKNCLLKDERSILGYAIFTTRRKAEMYAPEGAKAVKVLITVSRPIIYG